MKIKRKLYEYVINAKYIYQSQASIMPAFCLYVCFFYDNFAEQQRQQQTIRAMDFTPN